MKKIKKRLCFVHTWPSSSRRRLGLHDVQFPEGISDPELFIQWGHSLIFILQHKIFLQVISTHLNSLLSPQRNSFNSFPAEHRFLSCRGGKCPPCPLGRITYAYNSHEIYFKFFKLFKNLTGSTYIHKMRWMSQGEYHCLYDTTEHIVLKMIIIDRYNMLKTGAELGQVQPQLGLWLPWVVLSNIGLILTLDLTKKLSFWLLCC